MPLNQFSLRVRYPSPKLRSASVCSAISEMICRPVLNQGWSVSAFRMCLPLNNIQGLWDNICSIREDLDHLVQQIPGSLFFLSSIYATRTKAKISPSVTYWVVTKDAPSNITINDIMTSNQHLAQVKYMLQPYQTSESCISGVLLTALKDSMEGCVPGFLQGSCARLYGPGHSSRETVCKIYAAEDGPIQILQEAVNRLEPLKFRATLLYYEQKEDKF